MGDFSWGDIQVEVETILDENPNLYLQRAEVALKEKRYDDALNECEEAIRFSNQGLEYLFQKVRILFVLGRYVDCIRAVLNTNVWNDRGKLEATSREEMYKIFAISYKKCNLPLERMPLIILTDNGEGMCKTIQEAVDCCKKNQTIYLTTGTYRETVEINCHINITASSDLQIKPTITSLEKCVVGGENQTISLSNLNIIQSSDIKDKNRNSVLLFKDVDLKLYNCKISGNDRGIVCINSKIDMKQCNVQAENTTLICTEGTSGEFQNCELASVSNEEVNSFIEEGRIKFHNCIFKNIQEGIKAIDAEVHAYECEFIGRTDTSIAIINNDDTLKKSNLEVVKSKFRNCGVLINGDTLAWIEDSTFSGGEYGVLCDGNGNVNLINCKVENIQGRGISNGGQMNIINCSIKNNDPGIWSFGGSISIKDSSIKSNSESGIAIEKDGLVENCTIKSNKGFGLLLGGKVHVNNCTVQGNEVCGIAVTNGNTKIKFTEISDNGDAGLYCYGDGIVYIINSKVYCNKCANLATGDNAYMEVRECTVSSGSSYGIMAKDMSRCDIFDSEIFSNAKSGVVKLHKGLIFESRSNIHDNESIIGSLSGIRRFFTS